VPEPFIERQPPLFLHASKLIHAKRDMLGFWAIVKILDIHNFSPLDDSSDDSFDSSGSSWCDDITGSGGSNSLRPWLAMYHFTDSSLPFGRD
jgi:hypothetical protein